jgi:hypothetical protein
MALPVILQRDQPSVELVRVGRDMAPVVEKQPRMRRVRRHCVPVEDIFRCGVVAFSVGIETNRSSVHDGFDASSLPPQSE